MKTTGSASDPLWFKDAVIYELHVRAFADSNGDGIGDFRGLIERLDYLQDLGVTCLWLLPFFPSPLRDDGYDIADYRSVNPDYGTIEDFQEFLDATHARGMQVMIELVVNHTSDRHEWFQRAREAAPGSPERDFYVWSDSDAKYEGVRIIFTDTEKSNWTWDPVAKAYYWHRFFSHQPDLNFDNPAVLEEVLSVMRFWLDMGVDGIRLDAIPYLIERDGTSCENLPETHVVIKQIRAAMDAGYANRVILAEANQWPADVRPYFGDGDECHMAFHFPLMPRIFMAIRLEDSAPITEILAETPALPETCQWALFLRNHDELTLEMVTSEERDYMYLAYSADPRARLNLGIRRRLAPLMDNNRRRIELLNSLLFSFPGTPILYYGDEIGMGDNIYLGDRNGVRTPMQWSADRNAGFSRAAPSRLYSPAIMDPVYGYEAINVEAQQGDPSSLLHWVRNMIALRKLFRVFGRGTIEFLPTANRKVLAYLRRYENEVVLCVANLSRFAQHVELDLAGLEGWKPVEMFGYVDFPEIGRRPYALTPGPYGFLWFELHEPVSPVGAAGESFALSADDGWAGVLEGAGRARLETELLPKYLPNQRWFGSKSRRIRRTVIRDWAEGQTGEWASVFVDVEFDAGMPETYFVPLAMRFGLATEVPPSAIVAGIDSFRRGTGILFDAAHDEAARAEWLSWVERDVPVPTRIGALVPGRSGRFADLRGEGELPSARMGSEQSNTSIAFGDRLIYKLFRRQQPGENPEVEVGRHLTDRVGFAHIAPTAGAVDYRVGDAGPVSTLAVVQALVPNQGDGWHWMLGELERFYQECSLKAPDATDNEPPIGLAREAAAILGRRTAEMHLALATPTGDPEFDPQPLTAADGRALAEAFETAARTALDGLRDALPTLPDAVVETAGLVLGRRTRALSRFRALADLVGAGQRTRVHGDYHLGQVLRVLNDFVIVDFEGEPSRSIAARRERHSPLKDVAGMLRSFSYAAWAGLQQFTTRGPEGFARLEPWAALWERDVSAAFLREYLSAAGGAAFLPPDPDVRDLVVDAYMLDKAFYELQYELDNRRAWVWIPLRGLLSLEGVAR